MPYGIGYGKKSKPSKKGKPSKRYDGKRQSAMAGKLRNYSTGTAGGSGAG